MNTDKKDYPYVLIFVRWFSCRCFFKYLHFMCSPYQYWSLTT
uniref:Uncharacterized protein n=1 Tax=Anguilla anguilla TaxID=7936 RepID=A0A0E9U368_ANGAN